MAKVMQGALGSAIVLGLLTACGGERQGSGGGAPDSVVTVPAVPTVTLAAVAPNSFAGTLPCADCSGIETTVALFPDTTFRLREQSTGKPGDAQVSMGRWTHDGATLTLDGLGRTLRFAVAGEDTLRLLDQGGKPIAGSAPVTLVRADRMNALREPVTYTGTFGVMARAYTSAKLPPGSGQQVEVVARFVARPDDVAGPKERDVLEIRKYVGPAANPDCR